MIRTLLLTGPADGKVIQVTSWGPILTADVSLSAVYRPDEAIKVTTYLPQTLNVLGTLLTVGIPEGVRLDSPEVREAVARHVLSDTARDVAR